MSLMNDMLRDLDRRGIRSEKVPVSGDRTKARGRDTWLLASGVVGMMALVLALGIVLWPLFPEPDKAVPANPVSALSEPVTGIEAVDREVVASETSGPEEQGKANALTDSAKLLQPLSSVAPPQPTVLPYASSSAAAVKSERTPEAEPALPASRPAGVSDVAEVESLLARAREARRRDRLTRPAGENAYEFYQQVLVISPDNAEAKAGLAAIGLRYRELADAAQRRGEQALATQFLARARMMSPDSETIDAPEAVAASPVEPAESEAQEESSHFDVRPDPVSEDRRRANEAQQWWSRGQTSRARHALEQTLAQWSYPDVAPVASAVLLAELYLEQGELGRVDRLLAETPGLPEDERARLRALEQLQRGASVEALEHLLAHRDSAVENEPYRALLARLLYAQTEYANAVDHYRALLSDFGSRPAYWLGLGLAQEALNNTSPALDAFRRAMDSGAYRDDEPVRRFLKERIDLLSQQLSKRNS